MTPAAPDVRACWNLVVRGIAIGWLDEDSLAEVAQALADGTDRGFDELAFEHLGDELRVSFLDDEARCDPAVLRAMLLSLRAAQGEAPMIGALKQWSEALCRVATGGAAEVASALGITGHVTTHGDYADLEPPPIGTCKFMLVGKAQVGHLDITLLHGVKRSDLDAAFGTGNRLPRVGPGRPHRVAYHVAVAGAPSTCELFAQFEQSPDADAISNTVVLRRDSAS